MFGVRYTTARHTAQEAVDAVFRALGHATPPPCRTAETPLQGGSINHMDNFLQGGAAQRDVDGIPADDAASASPRPTAPATTACCRWPATCPRLAARSGAAAT